MWGARHDASLVLGGYLKRGGPIRAGSKTASRASHVVQAFLQRTAIWIPAGVIALLMAPLAVTTRTFGDDATLHLWLVRQQELNIQTSGRPGLFLSARPLGAFYPIFAFVGSGLYTVGGYLALALGDRPIVAYKLLFLGALCLAYGGMTWLSREVGLRGWRSQIPGLVFVTGAYFVTDMFARGDLGELMALSAIPFLVAAVTAVTVSSRLQARHLLGVVVAVFAFTGSHNITLVYGTIFLALLALVLLGANGFSGFARLPWSRLPALFAAATVGVGLNAWYLLDDLVYGLNTSVAQQNGKVTFGLSEWRLLLNPLRPSDPAYRIQAHDVRVSLPLLFAAWALVIAAVMWRRIDRIGHRLIVLFSGLAALYVYLIMTRKPWKSLPHFLYNIQFALRLNGYVLLATALLVMVVLVWQVRMTDAARRTTSGALIAIAVFSVGAATWQAWVVPSTYISGREVLRVAHRSVRPPSWYGGGDFRLTSRRDARAAATRSAIVPEAAVRGSTFRGRIHVPSGSGPFSTNIAAGPQFTRITGIKPIGLSADGFVVAVRAPGTPATGPVDITIGQAHTTLLRAGAVISMLSLAALALLLAWPLILWSRSRFAPVPLTGSERNHLAR